MEDTALNSDIHDSVWDALADTQQEAANLKARSALLYEIRKAVRSWNISQEEAARRLGLTRPRTNDLLRGKLAKFSLDALVNIAASADLEIEIRCGRRPNFSCPPSVPQPACYLLRDFGWGKMMHKFLSLAAAGLLAATAGPAVANDSMAELRTGGLAYVVTEDVSMVEENLFLSMDEVRVDYVFKNTSDKDVTSIIAFPMPDIVSQPESNVAVPDYEADNFLGFTVTQDGKAIQPQLQQRVSALSIDWTDELRSRKISVLPYSDKAMDDLKALPPETLKDWVGKGLLYADTFDAGQGWQTLYRPLWTLHSVYWWKTTFPAGKTVRVSHRYKPSVGGTVALSFIDQGKPGSTMTATRPATAWTMPS